MLKYSIMLTYVVLGNKREILNPRALFLRKVNLCEERVIFKVSFGASKML